MLYLTELIGADSKTTYGMINLHQSRRFSSCSLSQIHSKVQRHDVELNASVSNTSSSEMHFNALRGLT